MTKPLDLAKLKELAQAAAEPCSTGHATEQCQSCWANEELHVAGRPAVVLELLARLERAEAVVKLAATAWNDPYYYDRVGQAARAALAAAEEKS